jgi:hypothetical protein
MNFSPYMNTGLLRERSNESIPEVSEAMPNTVDRATVPSLLHCIHVIGAESST